MAKEKKTAEEEHLQSSLEFYKNCSEEDMRLLQAYRLVLQDLMRNSTQDVN